MARDKNQSKDQSRILARDTLLVMYETFLEMKDITQERSLVHGLTYSWQDNIVIANHDGELEEIDEFALLELAEKAVEIDCTIKIRGYLYTTDIKVTFMVSPSRRVRCIADKGSNMCTVWSIIEFDYVALPYIEIEEGA